jgi:hypothetical protein
MTGCVYADIRADKAVVTNGDWGFVEHSKIEVGKEPLAHTNHLFTPRFFRSTISEGIVLLATLQFH